MKILLLGATGRTGRYVLRQALERGYAVHALVRNPQRVAQARHPNLTLFTGTPTDAGIVQEAMAGCRAVISTLNISRTSDFPWSPLRTPPDFLSCSLRQIVAAMHHHQLQRLVLTSAWGTHETAADLPGWLRWFIAHSNLGPAYRDHERQELILQRTDLDWTAVRPVVLTPLRRIGTTRVTLNGQPKPSLTISRPQLAHFLLDLVEQESYVRQLPVVSTE